MGDVGAVATLLNTLAKWLMDPNGYEQLSRDQKLKALRDASIQAVDAGAWEAVDVLLARYKRLRDET